MWIFNLTLPNSNLLTSHCCYPKMKKPENPIQVSLQLIKDLKGKMKRPKEIQKPWVVVINPVSAHFIPSFLFSFDSFSTLRSEYSVLGIERSLSKALTKCATFPVYTENESYGKLLNGCWPTDLK